MFRNAQVVLCLFMFPFLFSSCFEVIEDVTVKRDGTGSMKLTVNFSQSQTKIAAIMMMDSIQGLKVPSRNEIQEQMEQAAARLRTMKGISNVSQSADFTNFIASISFSFKNVADVNNLVKELLDEYNVKTKLSATYHYDQQDARFTRAYNYSADVREQFNKLKDRDRDILRSASYISIFRFDNTISSYSNQAARMSKNQQAIMQRFPLSDLASGKADISNQIQLSR
jgi:hypothetical protein